MVGPKAKRAAAVHLLKIFFERRASKRRVSRVLGLNRSTVTYKPRPRTDELLRTRLLELSAKHRRFGLPRLHYLLRREGAVQSHHRTRRVYNMLGLQLNKHKRRKKQMAVTRVPLPTPEKPNSIWSFDFVSDRVGNDRRLKCLTIVDDFSKRSPGILAEYSITSFSMIHYFEKLPVLPKGLRCDNGPEMSSREFLDWAHRRQITVEYIQPGKPIQNAYIESFNSRFRDECLNEHEFESLEDAKKRIEKWRRYYNEERPHTSIDFKTPTEFEREFEQQP